MNEPRGIVFHDFDSATKVFSAHALPAWTNGDLIHIDPLVADWQRIFLSAIPCDVADDIFRDVSNYYLFLDIRDVATIVGHEVTHHMGCFARTFDAEINDAMWFEEGMCFYLPRKRLLFSQRFEALMRAEALLIELHRDQYGEHPVWRFGGSSVDGGGFVAALFDYWRATSAVRTIVEEYASGDVRKVLRVFEYWVEHLSSEQRFFDYVMETFHVPDVCRQKLAF
ncbi:hypothetical protein [Alicyclobacillus fastidiosus]|uniref:DUF1570 domain-containing protein n=1 Tax=Alicyclobacillus fastidiosus TaxID=392011 RepID=A0ABV5AC24_9BACL|nr:hypothetical protein [Alicyclobacillus fastidiosus]WEH10290.1 hypothetical protein PYS47_03400 [Alicyclobacillus fastidiosus]